MLERIRKELAKYEDEERIVEEGTTADVFANPGHPYTKGLIKSVPRLDTLLDRLSVIDGTVPDPADLPSGCPFNPRCPLADEHCRAEIPELETFSNNHNARCFKSEQVRTL